MTACAHLVEQEPRWPLVVGHQDIHVAIVVHVAERRAPAHLDEILLRVGTDGNRFEPDAVAAEELVRLGVRRSLAQFRPAKRHGPVSDEQVQESVVVEVEPLDPERGRGETRISEAARKGRVLEEAVTLVLVQGVRFVAEVRDEDVGVAVTVEVVHGDTHAGFGRPVAVERDAAEERGVLERAVPAVPPELVLVPVVRDVHIEPAIVVEVQDRDP